MGHFAKAAALAFVTLGITGSTYGSIDLSFTEDFTTDASNWYDASESGTSTWISTGGIGGAGDGYITADLDFSALADGDTPVLFRAHDEYDASGDAFVGNWIAEGVTEVSFWVRHDAAAPISFFTRIATPTNFPAANAVQFVPVLPGTWTEVVFTIAPDNPAVIYEGPASTYGSVFSNVGNLQFGVSVPASLAGSGTFTFDLDGVGAVPAPGAAALLPAALLLGRRRRRTV